MKSKLVILSLLLSGATLANAQTKEKYSSESWKDNIFISVGVGGQIVTNPSNFDYGFGESITPLVNISLGKFFSRYGVSVGRLPDGLVNFTLNILSRMLVRMKTGITTRRSLLH
ncbi:hypothetical protein [Bacteroides stercorirosoris]|uniref:hypothetical protein n=1 Tax=Bacteroides stercorirosoris TaxID=871324 RepID=UPI0004729C77|nr:hypothetical protein [Bacteroides stercorirosoris]